MKNKLILPFVSFTMVLISLVGCQKSIKVCDIQGEVFDSTCTSVVLFTLDQDYRFQGLEIPLVDGKFTHQVTYEQPEVYSILTKTGKKRNRDYFKFILEDKELPIQLYTGSDFNKSFADGGRINKEFKLYNDSVFGKYKQSLRPFGARIRELHRSKDYYTDTMNIIDQAMRSGPSKEERKRLIAAFEELKKTNAHLGPEALEIQEKQHALIKEQIRKQYEYISDNPTVISYYLLYMDVLHRQKYVDMDLVKEHYRKLVDEFPNHPYNEQLANIFGSEETVKVGAKFIDFTLPDMDGNEHKISDLVAGKIAVIDLWATWCGPCIAKSRALVPVYDEFKDSGFTIVGVAGEYKNTDGLAYMIDKHNFSWSHLVELDKKHRVWEKYGIPNVGGRKFLVDEKGIILAIDPSADDVRKVLKKKMKG
ncbi:peroxiredoxin family protein [Carboxylicivirga marina]|uniref:TlpA family protein disulfide reductase n=1 Tax=Carboxylicivirga marina TaxID=2800988 RepID=A0ABS1HF50_9BACT|nr:TlpA disulfide reductase family protein [Carboxylicivirga marina]MBK3515839.1 TlpA family protein disulfide reductase [Carboxylicivirga marina]